MTGDFYDVLDVSPDASQEEIKKAFRKQVRLYHPDLNDDERAQAQFTVLKKAYDVLDDPVERQAYDRLGHANYVAKRTSGLPSPDGWKHTTDEGDTTDESGSEADSENRSTSTAGDAHSGSTTSTSADRSSTSSRSTSRSTATGASGRSRSRTSTRSSSSAGGATSSSTSQTAGSTGTASTAGSTDTGSTSTARSTDRGSTSSAATDGHGTGTAGSRRRASERRSSRTGRLSPAALVRWWHSKNFAWPLIWLSALTYLAGLVHFGLENANELRALGAELAAVGADPEAAWALLAESRHGVDEPATFVLTVEPVAPPLPSTAWHATLAGLLVGSLLLVVGARVVWRRDTWGPITIGETLVVALALGAATLAVGGPLLAGTALMPLLFGVIVYRTHQLPGWSPSYGYVLAVCAPALALVAGTAGYASLPGDLLAFVVLPLAGAFGLPLRVQLRKRVGR